MSSLSIRRINKHYKSTQALTDIQLTFEENKIYALLGRNGAGKSTLLNIITGRILPTSGDILLDGQPLLENEKQMNQIFLTSEDCLYPDRRRIKDIFKLTEAFYGGFDLQYARYLCDLFELDERKKVRELSTGYRSIMQLIVALCVPVKFVFLDEPILGLDATHRELFYQELMRTYSECPRAFVISTHLIEEIANLIEEVIILDHGKVIEESDTETLLHKGKTISGPLEDVVNYTRSLNCIGMDQLGKLATAYVVDTLDSNDLPATLSCSSLNLQQYFVKLTERKLQEAHV